MKHWYAFFLAIAVLLAGTGHAVAADDRQELERQVKRYFAAEIDRDYPTVYGMLSVREQSKRSLEDYVKYRKEVGPLHYVSAETGEIVVAGDVAWVHLKFDALVPRYPGAHMTDTEWKLWQRTEGWHPVPGDEFDQWPALPPSLRPAAEEAAVAERSTRYWQAMVAQDWPRIHAFMPPWFRDSVPLERFLTNKSRYLYFSPRVEWVEVTGADARARISVAAKINDPAMTKMEPRPQSFLEPWVKVDGEWYLMVPLPPEAAGAPAKEKAN